MLALLIYCYATGWFHSREIEPATSADVAVRFICGGDLHPANASRHAAVSYRRAGIHYYITGGAGLIMEHVHDAGDFYHYLVVQATEKEVQVQVKELPPL